MIICVILAAGVPLIGMKLLTKDMNSDVIACVRTDDGSLSSSYCQNAINDCQYNMRNACQTFIYYAGKSDTKRSGMSRKALGLACDLGSNDACKYFIEACQRDSAECFKSDAYSGYNISYYLNMLSNSTHAGKMVIEELIPSYYSANYINIVNNADALCCNPTFNTACLAKSLTRCPPPTHFRIGTNFHDYFTMAIVDNTGNIYSFLANVNPPDRYSYMLKMDREFNIIWEKYSDKNKISPPVCDGPEIAFPKFGPDGYIYTSATAVCWSSYAGQVSKIDPATGAFVWVTTLGGGQTQAHNGTFDFYSEGNIYVGMSTSYRSYGSTDMLAVKLDKANGRIVWKMKFGKTKDDADGRIRIAPDGNVYMAGYEYSASFGGTTRADLVLAQLDKTDGHLIRQFHWGRTNVSMTLGGIYIDQGGNIYLTGNETGAKIFKLNPDLSMQYHRQLNGIGYNTWLQHMEIDTSGNVHILGDIDNTPAWKAIYLKLDNNGNLVSGRIIGNDNRLTYGNSIDIYSDGYVYIAGTQNVNAYTLSSNTYMDGYIFKIPYTDTFQMMSLGTYTVLSGPSTLSLNSWTGTWAYATVMSWYTGTLSTGDPLTISNMP